MGVIFYRVGANTHKDLESKVLMTLALVIN
jgi:hypothetical protein